MLQVDLDHGCHIVHVLLPDDSLYETIIDVSPDSFMQCPIDYPEGNVYLKGCVAFYVEQA